MKIENITPKVCVLLATHNGDSYLKYQVASIVSQVDVQVTLYISDDSSSDGTMEYLNNICLPNVIILPQIKVYSPALNFLNFFVNKFTIKYDYYAFADQDDIWLPNKLTKAIECLRKKNANCYSSDLIVFREDNLGHQFSYLRKSSIQKKYDYLFQGASAGCTYLIDLSAFELIHNLISKLGIEKNIISHEWFIYAICRSHNLKWHMDSSSYILYRQHSSNAYGSGSMISNFLKKMKIIRNKTFINSFLSLKRYLKNTEEEEIIYKSVTSNKYKDKIYLISKVFLLRRRWIDAIVLIFILLFRKK
jgi:rhamnosyltransferase